MTDTPPGTAGLTEGYEVLRALALGQETPLALPQGLALFLRQGMAGWIRAWRGAMTGNPVKVPAPSAGARMGAIEGRQTELVAMLAGMALVAAGR